MLCVRNTQGCTSLVLTSRDNDHTLPKLALSYNLIDNSQSSTIGVTTGKFFLLWSVPSCRLTSAKRRSRSRTSILTCGYLQDRRALYRVAETAQKLYSVHRELDLGASNCWSSWGGRKHSRPSWWCIKPDNHKLPVHQWAATSPETQANTTFFL